MSRQHFICTSSSVPMVEAIRIRALPKETALVITKIARHGRTTLYADAKGNLYAQGLNHSGSYGFGRGTFDDYIHCARKLGAITMAEARKHFKDATEHDKIIDARQRVSRFREHAKSLGIELTIAQQKKLTALSK